MADRQTESALIQLGRLWVIENYPYNSTHLLKSLEWVDRLAPDASEAVRLATLTHDMERAFGGPDAIPIKMSDRAYEEAHSNRSARLVGEWLRANEAPGGLASDVEDLIRVHEWGGSPDANLVQAADSLSFLETNARPDARVCEYGQVFAGRDRAQDSTRWYRAHSASRRHGAGAADVGAGEGAPGAAVRPFEYARPESLDEAFARLRSTGPARGYSRAGPIWWCGSARVTTLRRIVIDLKRVRALRADIVEIASASASARAR